MKFIVVYGDSDQDRLHCYSEEFISHRAALKFIKEFIYDSDYRKVLRFYVGESLVIPSKEELELNPAI